MMAATRRSVHALAGAATLAVLAVGVPVALVALVGWPLPRATPDWGRVSTAISQGDIPADVVVDALAVVVWVIWAQLTWALIWELTVNVPRIERGQRPATAPLVAAPVGTGMGRLVALVLSVTIATTTPTVAGALTAPTPVVAHVDPAPAPDTDTATPPPPAPAPAPTEGVSACWAVTPDDTLWRIAETALGDGSRTAEILELNTDLLRSARDLTAGQLVRLPPDAAIPTDRTPTPTAPPEDGGGFLAETEIVIAPGDNLWDLSEERLDTAHGQPAPNPAIAGYVADVIDANADVVEDPDLIYPGERFTFPAIGTPPPPAPPPAELAETAPPPAPPEPPTPDSATPTAPADTDGDPVGPADTDATAPATPDTAPAPTDPAAVDTAPAPGPAAVDTTAVVAAAATPAPDPPPTAPQPGPADRLGSSADRGSGDEAGTVPWIAGIGGATVLASGLLVGLRRRQARRAVTGAAAHRHNPTDPDTEHALVAASDLALVAWANHELADLFAALDARTLTAGPVAVEVSERHGIEILWDQPAPGAPRPWEATDNGWAWRLLYDPDLPVPTTPRPPPIPGLVTIGTRDDNQLLVDLEALGSVTVTGHPATAEALIRAITVELATGDHLADTYLHTVNLNHSPTLDLGGVEHLDRVQATTLDGALQHVRGIVADHERVLASSGLDTTLQLRTGRDGAAGRELHLTLIDARHTPEVSSDVDEITASAPARRGVAVVVLGDSADTAATLTVDADGTGRLEPLGITFRAAGIPSETMPIIAQVLEPADVVDERSADGNDQSPTDGDTQPVDHDDSTDDDHSDIRVLAGLVVAASEGAEVDAGSPTDVEVAGSDHDVSDTGLPADLDVASGDISGNGVAPELEVIPGGGAEGPGQLDLGFDLGDDDPGDDDGTLPRPELLVTLLGPPAVPAHPNLGRIETNLVAFLACNGRRATDDQLMDAVWGGRMVARATIWNRISKARTTLGAYLPARDQGSNKVTLHPGVGTDIDLLAALVDHATQLSSGQAAGVLTEGLDLIRGVPFDAPGYDWAHQRQHNARACELVENAALRLVDLALDEGDLGTARRAVSQGLRALPINEPLYRARMRIEAAADNAAGVRATYDELSTLLGDLSRDGFNYEPSTRTITLLSELTASSG